MIAIFEGTVNEETSRHSQEYFFYITLGIHFLGNPHPLYLQLVLHCLFQKLVHCRTGLPGCKAGMPGVELCNLLHLGIRQREVENAQVFFHALRVCGFYNGHDTALRQPAERHLRGRFPVACGDGTERFILEKVCLSCGQGRPCLHLDIPAFHIGAFILPLEERIALYQIDSRFHFIPEHKVRQLIRRKIIDADSPDFSGSVQLLQRTHAP